MTEDVKELKKQVDDIALKGASKADIAKLEKLISEGSSQPSTPEPATGQLDDKVKSELDELAKYRENERQTLLRRLPKEVIKEFKLEEKSLAEVKRISTLTKAIRKKTVGIDTPTPDTTTKEEVYQWNPETKKNEFC